MSTRLTEQDKDVDTSSHPANDYTDTKVKEVSIDNDTPVDEPNPKQADSEEQLQKDDEEAIDKGNIIGGRTRGGKPSKGQMREPGDDEGLPNE